MLVRELAVRVCRPRLVNDAVVAHGWTVGAAAQQRASKRVQGERSERALAVFGLSGPLAVLSNAALAGSGRALV